MKMSFSVSFASRMLAGLLAAVWVGCCSAETVWLLDLRGRPLEEKVAAFAVQGIANRKGPRVFVRLGADCRWMQLDLDAGNPEIWARDDAARMRKAGFETVEDVWIHQLSGKGGFVFKPIGLDALIAALGNEIQGAIRYQNVNEDLAPVATWAGLRDWVPVTTNLHGLAVAMDYRDIRKTLPGDKRLAGHRWMIDHLLQDCRKDGAVSRARLYGAAAHDTIVDIDQAVQRRWAVYDLNHAALTNRTAAPAKLRGIDPPDKALADAILSRMEPFSAVYGWGNPGEDDFIRTLNRHTLVGECSGVPNNSFFATLPVRPGFAFRQRRPHRTPADTPVENKIYVAFLVNEGDSIKCMNAFQGFGGWLQQERGRVPINWGIEPNLCFSHPALMAYYYETATTNDYFFAPPSGWGYTHPGTLPPADWMPYARKVREGLSKADLHFIDIWWVGGLRQAGKLDEFLKTAGVWGMTDWDNTQQRVLFTADNIPIIKSNHYYTYREEPEAFAKKLMEETKAVKTPWFVVIYGSEGHGTPHRFYSLAKALPAERFKVVALDEFFAAAKNARPLVEGRVLRPDQKIKRGVAP